MKTDTLKKSLLDYAIKGSLTAKFRRENAGLNAFDELEIYNDKIKQKRKDLEKKLKICEKEFKLEKDKDKKAFLKQEIQMLKKELTKCKEITPLFNQSHEVQPLKASSGVWGVKGGIRGATSRADEVKPVIRKFKPPCPPLKEKTNNTESTHNEAGESEAPFTIPNSWAWVKLGDICEDLFAGGDKPQLFSSTQTENCQVPIYTNGVKNNGLYGFTNEAYVKKSAITISGRGTIGFVCVRNEPFYPIIRLLVAIPNEAINLNYLAYVLMPLIPKSSGTSIPQLTIPMIQNLSIPLPPLCEQQEIVKKLDLLVSLANDFAITKENLKRIEKRIEKSLLKLALEGSLSKLYRRSSPTLCAFDEISTYNDEIKQKRKDLEKEFKKCEKEFKLEKDKDKKALCKSQIQMLKKELTKCKEITPLNLSESPFTIPNSWAWVKLGDICEIISGEIIDLQEENLPLLDVKYLRSKGDKKLANSGNFANANDRLILMDGENSGEIFITKEKGFLGSTLKKLEFSSLSQVEFMDFMLLCYKDFFKGNKKGAAIPHLDRKLFTNLSIPLPPLCEQEHIVQILDTLFTLKKGLD